ncbi:hypothetical protein RvY_01896 [Ramazzottius varieornatus]|uniref:Uncharacterized protein n=1 Tax=Ramazzottius varieornatus TaxID=947166 RepID=A0A1D1UPY9_RAMVA|nr:hypothetical protein RvY_01896 [Ramazzottius varieornatus]
MTGGKNSGIVPLLAYPVQKRFATKSSMFLYFKKMQCSMHWSNECFDQEGESFMFRADE